MDNFLKLAKPTQACLFPHFTLDWTESYGSELSFVLTGQESFAVKGGSANESFGCHLGEAYAGLSPSSLYIQHLLCYLNLTSGYASSFRPLSGNK